MSLNASKIKGSGNGSKFPPAEALEPDTYPARVVQVIDLGVQPQRAFQGKEKPPIQQVSITYELVDVFMKDENGEDDPEKPRWISERFPLHSLEADRAKSTQRYNAIDPKGKFGGDFSQIVGMPCSVLVTQYKKQDGTTGNGVGGVSPVMRGYTPPELVNEPKVFLCDEPDLDVFRSLPEWLQNLIKENLEFNGSALQAALEGAPAPKEEKKPAPKKEEPKQQQEEEEEDDSNPWD